MSSFFDEASLVFIPSGYKTSKAYSIKPTDGSGDMAFSRSNDTATRVGPDGLIEKVRTNLYPRGSALLATGWSSVGATLTAGQTDPNGGTTALRVQLAAAQAPYAYILQSFTGSAATYARSAYIKAASAQSIRIIDPHSGAGTTVNLTTDWQRFTAVGAGSGANFGIQFDNDNDDAAKDFTIAFLQIETGDIATDYIATTTAAVSVGPVANVPRLDYLGSSCPRLLLEPQRTNLVTYSEQFDNAAWTKAALGGAALTTVVTANQAVSPDGYTNADKVFMSLGGGTTSSDWARLQSEAFNVTSGTAYTITFWAWASQSSEVGKKVRVGVGGNTALLDFTLTATAQRFSVTYTAASTGTDSLLFQLRGAQGLASTAEFFLWGAQLEAGAYATSYIPTLGSASTRGQDVALKSGISSLIGQTSGSGQVTFTMDADSSVDVTVLLGLHAGESTANRVQVYSRFGLIYLFISANNTVLYNDWVVDPSAGDVVNIAFKYGSFGFVGYANGSQVVNITTPVVFTETLEMVTIGNRSGVSDFGKGQRVSQALVFPTALSNSDLAALTA